jgi:hypothetical protein
VVVLGGDDVAVDLDRAEVDGRVEGRKSLGRGQRVVERERDEVAVQAALICTCGSATASAASTIAAV